MAGKYRKLGVGLDLGSACLKSVVLGRRDGTPVLLRCHRLAVRGEGILNEADLYATVAEWLKQTECMGMPMSVGLPQFLSTTQVIDFPSGAGDAGLEEMVAFETRQLAGLSDEGFIHDYHVLSPGFGRRNPVLIGICRESVIRERMAALAQAGISAPHLVMSGMAAANALLHLKADVLSGQDPVLLVDIGRENSTAVILAAGQPLFVGSLLFGAERLVKGVMEREDVQEVEAEARLATVDLMEESPRSALAGAVRKLVSEIGDAIAHWRAQERQELAEAKLGGIWVCGGAAQVTGLAPYLSESLECPVGVFGPADPQTGRVMPDMATAYGLALQSVGVARVPLSLTPADVRNRAHRQQRFCFLVAACALVSVLAAAMMIRSYLAVQAELTALSHEMVELDACEKLIPRLEGARRSVERCESSLVPLVQAGSRGRRLVEALDALARTCGEKDWFVYLAYEESYQRQIVGSTPPRRDPVAAPEAGFPGADPRPVVGATVLAPEFPQRLVARQAVGMSSLIAAGYTPRERDQRWSSISGMIDRLCALGPYGKVDLLMEAERVGRKDIFEPWVEYLLAQPGALYDPFSLRLTLAVPEVAVPKKPEAAVKR